MQGVYGSVMRAKYMLIFSTKAINEKITRVNKHKYNPVFVHKLIGNSPVGSKISGCILSRPL